MRDFRVHTVFLEYTTKAYDYICGSGLIAFFKSNKYGPAFQPKSNLIQQLFYYVFAFLIPWKLLFYMR